MSKYFINSFKLTVCFIALYGCKKDTTTAFSYLNITKEGDALVEIHIPKADGNSEASKNINTILENFACEALHIDVSKNKQQTIDESISAFNNSYTAFKTQIAEGLSQDLPAWEALVDGEITYKTETLACIAMNSSIHTGAINSNMVLKFFNFDLKTGQQLSTEDLIVNRSEFKNLAEKYYNKEVLTTLENPILFDNDTFKLPNDLGFSEDGIIILYNNFDRIDAGNAIIEFTIPYEVASTYLKF